MKISSFIERYFWIFLFAGMIIGLWGPSPGEMKPVMPMVSLGLMLFLVFLKIDAMAILEHVRNFRLMLYIIAFYMFIIPVVFYFSTRIFDRELAIGILLLTSMPAGVSTPALTDLMKGNAALSMSLAILTQLLAPFTVPLLFLMVDFGGLAINKLLVFKDIALLVFVPMILSQIAKKYFPGIIKRKQHLFTSANVLLLCVFIYLAFSSQRDVLLSNPAGLVWKVAVLYFVFILLHIIGYMICFKRSRQDRIAVALGAAYMNNGIAIVLAISYFKPEILILMVLSELPWNTLLAPFRRVTASLG
jgi:bile acid:Na+ symporter, BASS family